MSLFHRSLDDLNEGDLRGVIDNRVREGRTIEYKERLPGTSEDEKREFRFDVSSFANAAGGDLLYGMKARREEGVSTGEAEDFSPLNVSPDAEALRLHQIIQSHIEPRIPGVRVRFIGLERGGFVGIVRIPKSWTGLHPVRLNDSFRFYSRTSAGRYIMDMSEIRAGFVASEMGRERLRQFRQERIARIKAGQGPIDMPDSPKVILHILPLSMLEPSIEWDLDLVRSDPAFEPIFCASSTHQYNFDGLVRYPVDRTTYVQLFRSGCLEACVSRLFDRENRILSASELEPLLIGSVNNYLQLLGKLGVSEPFSLALTLIGIHGYTLSINMMRHGRPATVRFREHDLFLPEILISSRASKAHTILRPAFDRIWNAAGRDGSPNYDESGNWIAPP